MKALKLPLTFNAEKLRQDVAAIKAAWLPHHRTDHSTSWDGLLLHAIDGDPSNNYYHRDTARFRFTEYYEQCAYIPEVIEALACDKKRIRFLRLAPGGLIKRHLDRSETLLNGEVRLHIPITTDPEIEFYLEHERVVMQPGELWYLNTLHRHWVRNNTEIERIHLVIDCVVNDWLMDIIDQVASPEDMAKERRTFAMRPALVVRDTLLQWAERTGERFGAQYY